MARDVDPKLLLPRSLRTLPADLAAICLLVFLTIAVVLIPGLNTTPVRALVGLVFVLFPPGYAFIAALFPEGSNPDESTIDAEESRLPRPGSGIDGLERVALSFGTSIAVVPLIGLILNFTPWGIRLVPILVSLSGFTLCMTAIAAIRRSRLPDEERFSVPYREWFGTTKTEVFEPDTRADAVLNVVLILSLLLAIGSVGYVTMVPNKGESFSEFYLLTKNDSGKLVADDYPTNFTRGESKPLYVGINNHEHQQEEYTVIVRLQRVKRMNNSTRVQQTQELKRFRTTLGTNSTWRKRHTVTPSMTGTRLRLQYLLYKGNVPTNPSKGSAYRELHLWVNVSSGSTPNALHSPGTSETRTIRAQG